MMHGCQARNSNFYSSLKKKKIFLVKKNLKKTFSEKISSEKWIKLAQSFILQAQSNHVSLLDR